MSKEILKRFPEKFRFQLSETEKNELVANCDRFAFSKFNKGALEVLGRLDK